MLYRDLWSAWKTHTYTHSQMHQHRVKYTCRRHTVPHRVINPRSTAREPCLGSASLFLTEQRLMSVSLPSVLIGHFPSKPPGSGPIRNPPPSENNRSARQNERAKNEGGQLCPSTRLRDTVGKTAVSLLLEQQRFEIKMWTQKPRQLREGRCSLPCFPLCKQAITWHSFRL